MVREATKKTERRDTQRVAIALEAILHYHDRDFLHAVTRDISLDGVFVQAPVASLRAGPTDIAIRLPADNGPKFHRFRAQVVHSGRRGAGFAFDSVETDAYEALLRLIFSRQPKSGP
jgi:c-di-GMP-binding flagellar brake protein YcgR